MNSCEAEHVGDNVVYAGVCRDQHPNNLNPRNNVIAVVIPNANSTPSWP